MYLALYNLKTFMKLLTDKLYLKAVIVLMGKFMITCFMN